MRDLSLFSFGLALAGALAAGACGADDSGRGGDSDADSDSDTDGDGDSDGDSDTDTGCEEVDFPVAGNPPDMLILLDRSHSMSWGTPTYWSTVTSSILETTAAMEAQIRFGLMAFPGGAVECAPPASAPLVPVGDLTAGEISAGLATTSPDGGGTPTTQAMEVAAAHLVSLPDASEKYILLATDGAPNCSTDLALQCGACQTTQMDGSSCYTHNDCLDDDLAMLAADEIHLVQGIDIYVVGVGGVLGAWDDTMNAIAMAGGTGAFYPAEDSSALQAAFFAITSALVDCSFTVDWEALGEGTSTDQSLVNLFGDGLLIPYDEGCAGGAGWQWIDEDTIELCEELCGDYADGVISEISATFGCESIVE